MHAYDVQDGGPREVLIRPEDEGFYGRFGFSRKTAKGLESRWPPHALLLAQPLARMPEIQGRLVEPRAFIGLE